MKYSSTLISILFFSIANAQDVALTWAKKFGGTGSDRAYSSAVDAAGNVYIAGNFNFAADFDPDPAVTFTLTPGSSFNPDVFIVKLNASGIFCVGKTIYRFC